MRTTVQKRKKKRTTFVYNMRKKNKQTIIPFYETSYDFHKRLKMYENFIFQIREI